MKWWRLPLLIVNFVLWFYLAILAFSRYVALDYALVNFDLTLGYGRHFVIE